MTTLNTSQPKSLQEYDSEIKAYQKALDELRTARQSTAKQTLKTRIDNFVQQLRTEAFNDEEIKDAFAEHCRRPDALPQPRPERKFATSDDQLCTNPEDSSHHWWTGKGGKPPLWATVQNLNKKLSLTEIYEIKQSTRV